MSRKTSTRPGAALDRFVVEDRGFTSPCWIWTGFVGPNGYGRSCYLSQKMLAHRMFYSVHVGPIPANLTLDHLCKVRCCVNPAHLEVVTRSENTARAHSDAKCRSQRHQRGKYWLDSETAQLRQMTAAGRLDREVAAILGRTLDSVRHQRREMGIQKTGGRRAEV